MFVAIILLLLYNIFGEAATPMLFFKIDRTLWSSVKSFIVFLGKFPEYPKTILHDIQVDMYCMKELLRIYNDGTE